MLSVNQNQLIETDNWTKGCKVFLPPKMKDGDIFCICDKLCKMKPNKQTNILSKHTKILANLGNQIS